MQYIRDNQGIAIGKLWVLNNGNKRIYSANGILLGWYDASSDRTIDAKTGSWMGFGDQTMLLLARC
ncbi:hypothetical protein [Alteromonas facilis]|uniref:hypothetical protein n=1 Tax=Alteromonas facilis TaxID=2048004 RepID=UPI000C285023|nr:hypothetical protein [Alteromonas facilis]